jgi:hypothetical protein
VGSVERAFRPANHVESVERTFRPANHVGAFRPANHADIERLARRFRILS